MNIYLIAVIVGIVEGVTEFLPVSSTGHMVVVGHMLGFDGPLASVFDVFIQLGAILSILFIYKERFARFFTKEGWQVNKGFSAWHVAAGIVPVALVGLILHGPIKHYLFSPYTVVIGLLAGSVLMMYAEKKMGPKNDELLDDIDKLSLKQAAQIGAYQIFSLWPGFSRSGSTLAGGLLTGVSRDCSAKYTFIIAVPLMFMACIYDLLKNLQNLNSNDLMILAIGFVVAFVVAYISVLWFLKFLHNSSLKAFAYYRIIFAIFTFIYFYTR
jgi:undecaprenyl-diphosphatase